ncbi:ABC-F family ATP-binding cassette domain-containing protein [Thermodesulfobacteriota bacterium]
MIFLHDVTKLFGGAPLFEGVSISIHRGDRVGIVGPNGAGKSTILGLMEGTIDADAGEVSIEKKIRMGVLHQELIRGSDGPILNELMNVNEEVRRMRERLADLEAKLELISDYTDEAESILEEHGRLQHEFERLDGYTLEARALKVLHGLGFKERDAARSWSEFSGGWRMRVALGKILLAEPDVLLLDEPTNHLDLDSLLWVEEYLSAFRGAFVLVSHDRAFLNRLAKKIVEVDRGKATSYTGNYDEFEKNKRMQENILLSAYKNQQEKKKRIQKFIDQNRVKARTASRVQSRVKMLEKMDTVEPPSSNKTVRFTFRQPPPCGRRVVEISDLTKRYDNHTVYEGFNLNIERGEKIGLVGPNGAGKSTLMKIVAGILPYEGGLVKYGHMVKPGYYAQHQSENLASDWTVLAEAQSTAPGATEQEVRSLLGAFLLSGDDVFKKVKVLSGGEKSRLALAKILLAPPNLLLMDEPTNHLDIPSCQVLEEALLQFEGNLILITHDRRLMNRICSGILEIDEGGAEYFIGNYEDYQYKKQLMEKEETSPLPPPEPEPELVETAPIESKTSRKERKRREAQQRQAVTKKKAPLKKEVKRIERELELKEARRKEIQDLMADPANYDDREKILPLLQEEPALTKEIKELESEWEDLQVKLEALERESVAS